jgi:hypothetical protein
MALQPFGPWPIFQFLNPIQSRQDSLDGGSARLETATYTPNSTNTEKTHTQASMPRVGFKPTIPVFERSKTVHAATVIGGRDLLRDNIPEFL